MCAQFLLVADVSEHRGTEGEEHQHARREQYRGDEHQIGLAGIIAKNLRGLGKEHQSDGDAERSGLSKPPAQPVQEKHGDESGDRPDGSGDPQEGTRCRLVPAV